MWTLAANAKLKYLVFHLPQFITVAPVMRRFSVRKLERVPISLLAMRLCYHPDFVRFRCCGNCSSQSHTNTEAGYMTSAFRVDDPVC